MRLVGPGPLGDKPHALPSVHTHPHTPLFPFPSGRPGPPLCRAWRRPGALTDPHVRRATPPSKGPVPVAAAGSSDGITGAGGGGRGARHPPCVRDGALRPPPPRALVRAGAPLGRVGRSASPRAKSRHPKCSPECARGRSMRVLGDPAGDTPRVPWGVRTAPPAAPSVCRVGLPCLWFSVGTGPLREGGLTSPGDCRHQGAAHGHSLPFRPANWGGEGGNALCIPRPVVLM